MITLRYKNNQPDLITYKLNKKSYDELVDDNFNIVAYEKTRTVTIDTARAVKWVTKKK